jgi:hypothetical protein
MRTQSHFRTLSLIPLFSLSLATSPPVNAGISQFCLGTTLVEMIRISEPTDSPGQSLPRFTYRYYYNHPLCRAER